MFFVWGHRMYGKVDQVPGVGYVVTEFFHLWLLPLIPTDTFVVAEGSEGDGFQGVGVERRWKSVLFAWLRVVLGATLAVGLLGMLLYTDAVTVSMAIANALALWGSYRITRASPARALEVRAHLAKAAHVWQPEHETASFG